MRYYCVVIYSEDLGQATRFIRTTKPDQVVGDIMMQMRPSLGHGPVSYEVREARWYGDTQGDVVNTVTSPS